MSPEQIAGDIAALDTRSDVYALGVILYRGARRTAAVRTGSQVARGGRADHPRRGADASALGDARRARPTSRRSSRRRSRRRRSAATARRRSSPRTSGASCATSRSPRGPPTTAYQVRKFARRHKALVAGVVAFVRGARRWRGRHVVAGDSRAARGARRQARAQEAEVEKAKAEAVTGFLTQMLASVDPSQARGRDVSVRDALDAAAARIDTGAMAKQPAVEIAVRNVIGTTYGSLGLFEAAERHLRAALDLETKTDAARSCARTPHARLVQRALRGGKAHGGGTVRARSAADCAAKRWARSHADVASSLDDLGAVLMARRHAACRAAGARGARDPTEAAAGRRSHARRRPQQSRVHPVEEREPEGGRGDVPRGPEHRPATRSATTIRKSRSSCSTWRCSIATSAARTRPRRWPGKRWRSGARSSVTSIPTFRDALDVVAGTLEDRGRNAEAEALLREALAIARRAYGEVNLNTARLQAQPRVGALEGGRVRRGRAAVSHRRRQHPEDLRADLSRRPACRRRTSRTI